jgi:HprK-related kinase A
MTNRPHHFSIGVVNVSLRSDCRSFVDEYLSLYGHCRRGIAGPDTIEVEVRSRHRFPWRGGPFTLHSEGVEDFQVERRFEVLPHLEWFINWQIINNRKDYIQLHASSLELGGNALILPGNPGSGKSTLTAGLLTRSWSYLCDEFALIDPRTLMIQPFPRALCMKEPSFPIVDRLGLRLCRRTPYHKSAKGRVAFLNPLDVRPDVVGRPSRVRWVVFPEYTAGARPTLVPLTRSQAAHELARQCFNFRVFQERTVPVLANVVRDADCYRLTAGDLDATCDLLESRLLRAASRKAG